MKKDQTIVNHVVIVLPWITHTENLGLKEVALEAIPKTGRDKINMLKPRRKNTSEKKLYCTAFTHKTEQPLLLKRKP